MSRIADAGPPAISPLLIPQPHRVVDRIIEADDVVSLHVVPVDGELAPFEPAQVGMLGAFGVGEAAISISSPVDTTDHHAYTTRRAGPITNALCDLPIGGLLTVRGPFGTPWPLPEVTTGHLLIVGGGLGIAPLRAAIDQAVRSPGRFERVTLVYGAKRPDQLLYRADLARWQELGLKLHLIVDETGPTGNDDEPWAGPVGRVPDLITRDLLTPDLLGRDGVNGVNDADTTVFLCGPDIMMHVAATNLLDLEVPADRIWLTLERNMQCGNALCGHCQLGPFIVCRDGPVARYDEIGPFHSIEGL